MTCAKNIEAASLWLRLLSMLYDLLLVIAWIITAAFVLFLIFPALLEQSPSNRLIIQCYCIFCTISYFIICWHQSQTLGMRAWRLRYDFQQPKYKAITNRLLLSLTGLALWGLVAVIVRRDKQSWLDILCKMIVIQYPKT